MGRPRNERSGAKGSARRRASGKVERDVVWVPSEGRYREVLDSSGPNFKLGEEVHSVISDKKSGKGHFEYGPSKDVRNG